MCGRYVSPDTASIERAWHIGRINSNPFSRHFNVAPTTTIPLIRGWAKARRLEVQLSL
jgi:putative SOS response-associated peptidase YedK